MTAPDHDTYRALLEEVLSAWREEITQRGGPWEDLATTRLAAWEHRLAGLDQEETDEVWR